MPPIAAWRRCGVARVKLILDEGGPGFAPRLGSADPLPPEDRVRDLARWTVETVYRSQAPRLLRFFSRKGDKSDAEDLLSESFARFTAASNGARDSIANPEGYLHEVAKNVLRNRAKAAFHRSIVDLDGDIADTAVAADLTATLEARDMLVRAQAALERLPSKTRSIFVAHRLDGATYAELAEAHGLSVKGVEWHMSKAIAQMHRVAGKK